MKMQPKLLLVLLVIPLSACLSDSRSEVLATDKSQVQLRAVETRVFETTNRIAVFRAAVSTLQDLGFIIDDSDSNLGTISGTKLAGYAMRMTVTIRSLDPSQTAVRASAQYNLNAVSDAAPYQRFFEALQKAMFLSANKID